MAGELEAIIDRCFCVAKEGVPLQPIFMRNHPSLDDNPKGLKVLIQNRTAWFDAGTLEYVCRRHRLPQCVLACGAVPKNTDPFVRMITDGRTIIVFARAWRVKYVTVTVMKPLFSRRYVTFLTAAQSPLFGAQPLLFGALQYWRDCL